MSGETVIETPDNEPPTARMATWKDSVSPRSASIDAAVRRPGSDQDGMRTVEGVTHATGEPADLAATGAACARRPAGDPTRTIADTSTTARRERATSRPPLPRATAASIPPGRRHHNEHAPSATYPENDHGSVITYGQPR
jgi:hypothetical protein